MRMPFARRNSFLWRTTTALRIFFFIASEPFFTATVTMSPTPTFGYMLRTACAPFVPIICTIFAPELSLHSIVEPVQRPFVTLEPNPFIFYTHFIPHAALRLPWLPCLPRERAFPAAFSRALPIPRAFRARLLRPL